MSQLPLNFGRRHCRKESISLTDFSVCRLFLHCIARLYHLILFNKIFIYHSVLFVSTVFVILSCRLRGNNFHFATLCVGKFQGGVIYLHEHYIIKNLWTAVGGSSHLYRYGPCICRTSCMLIPFCPKGVGMWLWSIFNWCGKFRGGVISDPLVGTGGLLLVRGFRPLSSY